MLLLASFMVSARELSLAEIKELRENIPAELEIETFIHGAMCYIYSGQCFFSSFLGGRSGNRGKTAGATAGTCFGTFLEADLAG
mgnify:CR=1 FL=1